MKKFIVGLLSVFALSIAQSSATVTAKAPASSALIVDGGPPGPCILCRGTGG